LKKYSNIHVTVNLMSYTTSTCKSDHGNAICNSQTEFIILPDKHISSCCVME